MAQKRKGIGSIWDIGVHTCIWGRRPVLDIYILEAHDDTFLLSWVTTFMIGEFFPAFYTISFTSRTDKFAQRIQKQMHDYV